MKLLDLTLPTPAENLALDEALLEEAEAARDSEEILRLWELPQHAVILGRSSKAADEVNLAYCRANSIPVLRRCSGGTAVVIGPGCLIYSVVLNCELRPNLRMIDHCHRFVLGEIARAMRRLGIESSFEEPCDLTLGDRKISGNSLRCKRNSLLYHGTILYGMPGELIEKCLGKPPRQPDYRRGRAHDAFVTNVSLSSAALRLSLAAVWRATTMLDNWPREQTAKLVDDRYSHDAWNFRL